MLHLNYLFDLCITTTVKGSIIIILIFIFQRTFKDNFSEKWIYSLWLLAIIRFLFPLSPFRNPVSLYNLGLIKKMLFSTNDILLGRLIASSNSFQSIGKNIKVTEFISNSLAINIKSLLTLIWISGISILIIVFIIIIIKLHFVIINSYKCEDKELLNILTQYQIKISNRRYLNIYISSKISTPMTFGIMRPKIIIPETALLKLEQRKLGYIILHELVHIKRHDVLFTNLALLICILNWFNPIVWIAFLRSKKHCELACDEEVLQCLNHIEYIQYGLTLISILELFSHKSSLGYSISKALVYNRSEASTRILKISNYNKKPKFIVIISLIILIFIALVGLNDSSNTRISNVLAKYNLSNYIQASQQDVNIKFGIKPKQTFLLKVNSTPYFIVYYNIFGERIQFWFDGTIGNTAKKVLEITTSSYKGIHQGMSFNRAQKIAKINFDKLVYVEETASLSKYIYDTTDYNVMIIFDKNTRKVYSLTLFKD